MSNENENVTPEATPEATATPEVATPEATPEAPATEAAPEATDPAPEAGSEAPAEAPAPEAPAEGGEAANVDPQPKNNEGSVDILDSGRVVRTYTQELHGDGFRELAEQFATKHKHEGYVCR